MIFKEAVPWWRTRFEERLAQHPGGQITARIDGVEKFLSLEARDRVLDLACGDGRQTLELSRRGYRVLGIDSEKAPLAAALRTAREERLNVHFLRSDLRKLSYRCEFDAVVNLGSSIGYLPSDRDHLKVLECASRGLKHAGHVLLDLLNKEWLMRHFEPNFWEQGEENRGDVVLDRVSFNLETGRLDDHRTIVRTDGSRCPAFVSLRVYTLTEIKLLLERAGLSYCRVWGGYDGQPYGMDSPRMIILAVKPEEQPRRAKKNEGLVTAIRIKGRRKG